MAKTYDINNTKMTIEMETGKQKKNPEKEWKGIRVRIGDVTRVIFLTTKETEYAEKIIEANK